MVKIHYEPFDYVSDQNGDVYVVRAATQDNLRLAGHLAYYSATGGRLEKSDAHLGANR